MKFECVSARFHFFNGQKTYTVEYAYALKRWYVFEDKKETDAVYSKQINPASHKSPNRTEAEIILDEYLEA